MYLSLSYQGFHSINYYGDHNISTPTFIQCIQIEFIICEVCECTGGHVKIFLPIVCAVKTQRGRIIFLSPPGGPF